MRERVYKTDNKRSNDEGNTMAMSTARRIKKSNEMAKMFLFIANFEGYIMRLSRQAPLDSLIHQPLPKVRASKDNVPS